MKKRKYSLVKTFIASAIISGTIFYVGTNKYVLADTKPVNNILFNQEFYDELEYLNNIDSITFNNEELYNIVSSAVGGKLTTENIKEIKSLEITEPLSNTDLSDLKYLTNLRFLTIKNNPIDASYLQYNQQLNSLSFYNCELYSTSKLPNSISYISIDSTIIPDGVLSTPYNISTLVLYNSPISKLDLKNPSNLKRLEIYNNSYISLTDIEQCSNLHTIIINRTSSIKDSYILSILPSLKELYLDEYASIWLDKETLDSLPIDKDTKKQISTSLNIIEDILTKIKDDNLTEEEKINKIIIYLIKNYNYNPYVSEKIGDYQKISYECNIKPISSLTREDGIVCINYSCLFQALANRLGLDANEIQNDIHAWNSINIDGQIKYFDSTSLDSLDNEDIISSIINNGFTNLPYCNMTTLDSNAYNNFQGPVLNYLCSTDIGYFNEPNKDLYSLYYNEFIFRILQYTNTKNGKIELTKIFLLHIILISQIITLTKLLLEKTKNNKTKKLSR